MSKKTLPEGFGEGSSPQTGNLSDNALKLITGIPTRTLTRWKNENELNYKRKLYRLLKVIKPEEYGELNNRLKDFENL